jgi:hypothetical protein
MQTVEKRLQALESMLTLNEGTLRDFIGLEAGADPLEALKGRGPGFYVFLDAVTDGAVFLGRVSRSGRPSVKRIGGKHATS